MIIEWGDGSIINVHGDIAFRRFYHKPRKTYQAFVYINGAIWQITNDEHVQYNWITDLNDRGEFVLVTGKWGKIQIKYGRLIR